MNWDMTVVVVVEIWVYANRNVLLYFVYHQTITYNFVVAKNSRKFLCAATCSLVSMPHSFSSSSTTMITTRGGIVTDDGGTITEHQTWRIAEHISSVAAKSNCSSEHFYLLKRPIRKRSLHYRHETRKGMARSTTDRRRGAEQSTWESTITEKLARFSLDATDVQWKISLWPRIKYHTEE